MTTTNKTTRKQEILEVAAELFRDKGYSASTVRDIADKVGIEAASLYNHINSKDEILHDICFEIGNMFISEMRKVVANKENVLTKLQMLIHLHIDITIQHAAMVSVANDEWRHLSEPKLSEFINMRANYENCFRGILDDGIVYGELIEIDSTTALYTILSSVRWLQYWFKTDRKVSAQQIKKDITDFLLKGLKK